MKKKEMGLSLYGQVQFSCCNIDEKKMMLEKIDLVEGKLGCHKLSGVSNEDVLGEVFDFYIEKNNLTPNERAYHLLGCDATDGYLFLSTPLAMNNIISGVHQHTTHCVFTEYP